MDLSRRSFVSGIFSAIGLCKVATSEEKQNPKMAVPDFSAIERLYKAGAITPNEVRFLIHKYNGPIPPVSIDKIVWDSPRIG